MGCKELIDSLHRTRDDKIAAIRSEAETESAKIKSETDERLRSLREAHERERTAAESERLGQALFQANIEARRRMLKAEQDLSERFYRAAAGALKELRGAKYPDLFAKLANELPPFPWKTVTVAPDDLALAARHFPGALAVPDPSISGGMEVASEENRVNVLNTFEKRL